MAISLISVDHSGICSLLAPGNPVTIPNGANTQTYQWDDLYHTMSNTELQELNIYKVDNSITVQDGMKIFGITYIFKDNEVIASPILSPVYVSETQKSKLELLAAKVKHEASMICFDISKQIVPEDLHTTLNNLFEAIDSSNTDDQLEIALINFESSINNIVSNLNKTKLKVSLPDKIILKE